MTGNRGIDVTLGSIESPLHIVSATYPDDDGVTEPTLMISLSPARSAFVTVQVNGE